MVQLREFGDDSWVYIIVRRFQRSTAEAVSFCQAFLGLRPAAAGSEAAACKRPGMSETWDAHATLIKVTKQKSSKKRSNSTYK